MQGRARTMPQPLYGKRLPYVLRLTRSATNDALASQKDDRIAKRDFANAARTASFPASHQASGLNRPGASAVMFHWKLPDGSVGLWWPAVAARAPQGTR
jgi:hypothetical protein